jgi:hypothetical protein
MDAMRDVEENRAEVVKENRRLASDMEKSV